MENGFTGSPPPRENFLDFPAEPTEHKTNTHKPNTKTLYGNFTKVKK